MKSDTKSDSRSRTVKRRAVVKSIGMALAAAPLAQLLACSSSDTNATTGAGGTGGAGGEGGAGTTSASGNGGAGGAGGSTNPSGEWATGGTASMTGTYADPFTEGLGSVCTLACAATLGPCYAATLTRKDISEGQNGLPVRLAFLVVDETCKPIEGATIDIWHTSATGLYSGDDSVEMCTLNDPEALASRWFRGVQAADAKGRADFDTCFPGWYKGRTIHIHFTVRVGDVELVTSQLFFDDALSDAIIAKEPVYKDRGERDTTNQNDNVISADEVGEYVFQTERMPDGAMLAWKTLVIRSSVMDELCQLKGGMGGPPMP